MRKLSSKRKLLNVIISSMMPPGRYQAFWCTLSSIWNPLNNLELWDNAKLCIPEFCVFMHFIICRLSCTDLFLHSVDYWCHLAHWRDWETGGRISFRLCDDMQERQTSLTALALLVIDVGQGVMYIISTLLNQSILYTGIVYYKALNIIFALV